MKKREKRVRESKKNFSFFVLAKKIARTSEKTEQKIDWTKMWGKKYPVLTTYQEKVDIGHYAAALEELLQSLKTSYGYNDLDAMLVLKDILSHIWQGK